MHKFTQLIIVGTPTLLIISSTSFSSFTISATILSYTTVLHYIQQLSLQYKAQNRKFCYLLLIYYVLLLYVYVPIGRYTNYCII